MQDRLGPDPIPNSNYEVEGKNPYMPFKLGANPIHSSNSRYKMVLGSIVLINDPPLDIYRNKSDHLDLSDDFLLFFFSKSIKFCIYAFP